MAEDDQAPAAIACSLCGRAVEEPSPGEKATLEDEATFCSPGCRRVWEALEPDPSADLAVESGPPNLSTDVRDEPLEAADEDGESEGPLKDATGEAKEALRDADVENEGSPDDADGDPTEGENETSPEAEADEGSDQDDQDEGGDQRDQDEGDEQDDRPPIRTHLRVDGMHTATCEAYLESVATDLDGVLEAEASYVTESVRVDHDPTAVAPEELRDALSITGYTAYLREDAGSQIQADQTGKSRRSREMSGVRKRRTDDMRQVRYVLGVVFGSFLLLPYVVMLYPSYMADMAPIGPLSSFQTIFTDGGIMFMRVYFVLTGIVLYVTGMPLLRGAYVSLKLRRPNTDLLAAMTIVGAYLYSSVAVFVTSPNVYFDLVLVVASAVMGAILYESMVKQRAMDRLTELTISQVDSARRYEADGSTTDVDVADLEAGDTVLIKQGERIPIDGVLAEGACTVDEAIVTGESVPIAKAAGDEVVGGSIVTADAAVIEVDDRGSSSLERLTDTVWNLQTAVHGAQRRVDDLADRLVRPLVGTAIVAGVVALVLGRGPGEATLWSLTVVLVGTPWLLGVATPLSIATTIEAVLERGIVVFDETVFERLRAIDTIVFDKTGTLTRGEMTVLEAEAPDELLSAAGALEQRASHPAADAIARAYGAGGSDSTGTDHGDDTATRPDGGAAGEHATVNRVSDFESHGNAVEGAVGDSRVLVGHPDAFVDRGWTLGADVETRASEARGFGRLPVVVGRDGTAEGVIVVGDEVRGGWEETLSGLEARGMDVVVLTGDDPEATDAFEAHPAVSHAFAGVPPEGKVATVRHLRERGQVAMVGDGTNDAPALAEADLGISLGSGTDLASDASDLAIVEDDLASIETAFELAAAARKRVEQNERLAFSYNVLTIPAAAAGLLNPLVAILASVVGLGLLGGNCLRSLLE
ncbi:heavy metal translocating P-type ATPase [Natronosalvus caseinilyticus]|uniref:heavy metal translocating P-type ATPase n=1 Tax=Natronosalvus caseinilyticus TaxID=2953747 RepID=UPI0028AC584D|nr:heavy metal translocating P-type ATPase [Natronosalvus caseinilyticus]